MWDSVLLPLLRNMSSPDKIVAEIPEEVEHAAKEGASSHEANAAREGESLEHGVDPEAAVVRNQADPGQVNQAEET